MLYNKDFLLLHFPKTAGKSVAVYFCKNLPGPVHGVVSPGQVREIGLGPEDGVHLEVADSHDNFSSARRILAGRGIDIYGFKALWLPVRNPYDLAVSQYYFLRQSFERNEAVRSRANFALAARTTFAEFCAQSNWGDLSNYLPPADAPSNLAVELIHFENLAGSLRGILQKYGIEETHPLPHLNASRRPVALAEVIDPETKRHLDEKLDAMFRIGGYEKTLIPA